jgi:hypothetical protein
MLKLLAVALAVGSFGALGADTAKAACGCPAQAAPAVSAAAPAGVPTASAPAVANRSYRSFSYQPGSQAAPTYRSYSAPRTGFGGSPSWDAGRKIRGF